MRARGHPKSRRAPALLALTLLLVPATGAALVPLLAALAKQIVQDMVMGEIEGQLIGALAGMGCKGARLAGLIATASAKHRPGGLPGMGGLAGMPAGASPGGVAPSMAGGPGMPGGALPQGMPQGMSMPPGMTMPNVPRAPGTPGAGAGGALPGGMPMGGGMAMGGGRSMGQATGVGSSGRMDLPTMTPEAAGDMSQVLAAMQAKYGGTMTPDQMARAQETMRGIQRASEHPLTRSETLEVFDELKGLGVLTDSMHSEARDCILLAPAGSDAALGQSGAMIREVVLPQLRDTRAKLANLGPEEQVQLAQGIADALRDASPADRKAFQEGLGLGFFPPAVVEKARAAAR